MTRTQTDAREVLRRRELAILVIVLLAATALRTWRLDTIPPGLTHDEAGHGHDAVAILNGARPIYETVGYGREPLYDYWIAGLMALGGRTREVLRFSAVPLGIVTLLATFAWTRNAFDTTVALVSTALQSVSFWSLSTGRQALRSSLLPALFTGAIYFFWQYIDRPGGRRARWSLGAFAVLIGATLYTYIPARGLWLIFALYLFYLALFHRAAFRARAGRALAALGIGLLLSLPLFLYLRTHPGAEQRLTMLDAPVKALLRGNPLVVLDRAWSFLLALVIPGRGDDFLAYTIPGRPIFGPILAVLFLIGVVISLTRWRRPAYTFSLIWFLVGIGPSLITGPAGSTTRSIAALPVIFLFPSIAVAAALRQAHWQWGDCGRWLVGLAACGLLIVMTVLSAADYFVAWGESRHTRAAYQHTLTETAAYLDDQPTGGVVGISTAQPYAPHDPYVFDISLDRTDLSFRWFDGRRALILPPQPRARLVVPSSAPLTGSLAQLPGLEWEERVRLRPDDLDPWFDVYAWQPRVTRTGLLRRIGNSSVNTSLEGALSGEASDELALPASFGGALGLLGYDVSTSKVSAGEEIEVLTVWDVESPELVRTTDPADVGGEPVIFVHAVDEDGSLVAQEDRLDAPAWSWQQGDGLAQVHRLSVPPDAAYGRLALAVGLYRRTDGVRVPIDVDGQTVGDLLYFCPQGLQEQ